MTISMLSSLGVAFGASGAAGVGVTVLGAVVLGVSADGVLLGVFVF